ncbi:TPA: hypothetical protein MPK85_005173, partial [Salmonella enterica]|nr:hypothetical protein [Salmonella enterica]
FNPVRTKKSWQEKYTLERDGQLDFFDRFLPRVDPSLNIQNILSDNTDGVINGNLLEFKLHVADLNAVLFQCIKYLSAMRIKGKPVPANILITDLNAAKIWCYRSADYLNFIEQPYTGSASKDNAGFTGSAATETLFYETNPHDTTRVISLLKEKNFTRINIDENCIVGWAEHFYRHVPTARKEDFLGDDTGKHKKTGEIRKPVVFSDYIIPYKGRSNVKFHYLMDKLNDFLLRKNLGAFYTPPLYAKKALELVRLAISRVPEGNDYIILDRCAGTGNLESYMTDEELSHTIVSTVEYYEYKVMQELLGSRVRGIIPPVENADTFNAGLVTGADALSREFINNSLIREYVDNPNVTIILFENPPYTEPQAIAGQKKSPWLRSYVVQAMKSEVKGTVSNDLGNAFIWSAFKYYLRQPSDSYVVFSPVKYWKAQHLVKKQFLKGFAFNRRHFHTSIDACIMCALWANVDDTAITELKLTGYDIRDGKPEKYPDELSVRKIHSLFSQLFYDKRPSDDAEKGITVGLDGLESPNKSRIVPMYSKDILGYMIAQSSGYDQPDLNSSLLITGCYRGNGFFLRKDNYLEKLPMFCASRYITYNRGWTDRARIMKSADGAVAFFRDVANGRLKQFLLKGLLFTCLEMQNHMRTFTGSDSRFYRNEICFDGTNGETLALHDIKELKMNSAEETLISQWETVLRYARQTKANERNNGGYNPALTYGVYQIFAELDTSYRDEATGKTVYDNVELHSALTLLKTLIKNYYNTEIVPVLFEYEFIK